MTNYDATETVKITPDGIFVNGAQVPGCIDADSVYVKREPSVVDPSLYRVTLTIMAGRVDLHDDVGMSWNTDDRGVQIELPSIVPTKE